MYVLQLSSAWAQLKNQSAHGSVCVKLLLTQLLESDLNMNKTYVDLAGAFLNFS